MTDKIEAFIEEAKWNAAGFAEYYDVVNVAALRQFLSNLRIASEDEVIVPGVETFDIFQAAKREIEKLGTYNDGKVRCTADEFAEIYKAVLSEASK